MKILIVEDNTQTIQHLRLWLGDLASEIIECEDGAEALECYRKCFPDWVLMDWEMKRMDGLTATREIISAYPAAKILIVTLHNKNELQTAAEKAGACGFICKDNLQTLRQFLI
ncbi:MAG: response regulator transcription factor [Acidobacteriota bacterium]